MIDVKCTPIRGRNTSSGKAYVTDQVNWNQKCMKHSMRLIPCKCACTNPKILDGFCRRSILHLQLVSSASTTCKRQNVNYPQQKFASFISLFGSPDCLSLNASSLVSLRLSHNWRLKRETSTAAQNSKKKQTTFSKPLFASTPCFSKQCF